jgi:branched-chain amino acid transport system permease protein/neutral amino acid transport system permease protein
MELVVNGLFVGTIIALGAMGLTMVYGILKFANIAHGDYMTWGAYISFFLIGTYFPKIGLSGTGLGPFTFGPSLFLAIPLAILVVVAIAFILDELVYKRLRRRGVSMVVLAMTSLGVAIALRGLIQVIWGGGAEPYPRLSKLQYQLPFDVRVPPDAIFIVAVTVILVVALYLFLTRSKMGKAMRATSDNPELARVSGIRTERVVLWTWLIGAALAATAGVLLAVFQAQVYPVMGWKLLIPLFAAVILGGIGNPYGALAGGLIIGVSAEVSTQWFLSSYKPAIAFGIMILTLLIRPRGLLGVKD